MAAITGADSENQASQPIQPEAEPENRISPVALLYRYRWLVWAAVVGMVLVVSLMAWGPGMDFPTTVSTTSEVPTDRRRNSITHGENGPTGDRRTPSTSAVDWINHRSGSWLFNGAEHRQ